MHPREITGVVAAATFIAAPATGLASTTTVPAHPSTALPPQSCELVFGFKGSKPHTLLSEPLHPGDRPCDGTMRIRASADQTHWKTVAQGHQAADNVDQVSGPCLPGTNWYLAAFIANDSSFKAVSDAVQHTC
jgi:hypothetical protein